MNERRSDRYLSIALSVLIHGAIVGALAFGWWRLRNPAPVPQTLAIEATLVRPQPATSAAPPTPVPPEPAPAPANPPPPTPQPDDAAEQARKAEQQRKADEERKAEQERAEQQKEREVAERKAKEEADRAAQLEAERKAKEDAARKAKAEADRHAQELAQAQQAARAQRESELQSQLAAEEHLNSVRASGEQTQYINLIRARIERAWIRPSSARSGINCEVHVTQVPGGEVTGVQVGSCNGDEAVRQSIEAAVYRASPLPPPPDPALFERNLIVNFRPSE